MIVKCERILLLKFCQRVLLACSDNDAVGMCTRTCRHIWNTVCIGLLLLYHSLFNCSTIKTLKSITARKLFESHPEIKKKLWGGHLWSSGYYVNTVGRHGTFDTIRNYVENQGKDYRQIYRNQLKLF